MSFNRYVFYLAPIVLLCVVPLAAQRPQTNRLYDPATETTLKGKVIDISQPTKGRLNGLHLTVQSDQGTTEVALGPATFAREKGFTFAKNDSVDVVGSKVSVSGKEYVIAREVTREGKTLTLRDKNGIPEWAGRGQGGRGQR